MKILCLHDVWKFNSSRKNMVANHTSMYIYPILIREKFAPFISLY